MPSEEVLARLAEANINLLPIDLEKHYMFERDGFVALVERRGDAFGTTGAAGLLTPTGLAPLVWRDGRSVFVNKSSSQDAAPEQVAALRKFQSDLESALHPSNAPGRSAR